MTTNPDSRKSESRRRQSLVTSYVRCTPVSSTRTAHEYRFGNDTEEAAELRETAAVQLGMPVRVLADRSDSRVEEITDLAVARAEQMVLR